MPLPSILGAGSGLSPPSKIVASATSLTEIQAAEAEKSLKDWVCDVRQSGLGPSHWNTLLKIRREVLAEKRVAERLAKREAQERADLALTTASIIFVLIAAFIGSTWYLHHMGWIDVRDYFRW